MRRFQCALFAAVAVIGFASVASAADMPVKTRPVPVAVAYNWTGWYVGATAGGAWSTADVSLNAVNGATILYDPTDFAGVNSLGSPRIKGSHAIFGGKIGYNQQFNAWVVGLEADISSFRFNKTATTTGNPFTLGCGGPPCFVTFNSNVSTTWLATVRPRIGYAFDRALVYATGGLAFAKVSFSNTYLDFAPRGGGFGNEASAASQTKMGWAAGAGIDYGLTPNWIVSVEYLHVDLGSINASGLVTSGSPATATLNFSTKLKSDIVRAGISYKF